MGVQLPVAEIAGAGRSAVPSHGVRERDLEQVVVADQQPLQDLRKAVALRLLQVGNPQDVAARHEQRLKRPHRPVRDQRQPMLVCRHHADMFGLFKPQVIEKQNRAVLGPVLALMRIFLGRFVWNRAPGPELPMGMRIRTPHDLTPVLEDLHPPVAATQFLNLASHELNTPLTTIKGHIQVAQRRLAKLKRQLAEQPGGVSEQLEQVQDTLASATQSARQEERIIRDLLDDARLQSNTLQLHPTRWDLNALLRAAVATRQRAAPGRTIVLESLPPERVVPVMADAERITQVITRYLTNALSSSPADQPVTVQLTAEGAVARVSVHAQGPDIPGEEQGHIWERFYHAKRTAVQHELDLSVGLGFYLSRAFIERHHGSVGVQSAPGRGTTFWFTLPVEGSPQR